MAHVITDNCVKDYACVEACPGDAIHPTKDEAAAQTTAQLFINPAECMDCGACISECTKDAIFPADELPADKKGAAEKNAAFYN